MWRAGWCADYADENNWVHEQFHFRISRNRPKWSEDDPAAIEFMKLTEEAAAEPDPAKRKKLYFQAEKILVEDYAVIIPIYLYTRVVCSKSYIERGYSPLGAEHWHWWKVRAHQGSRSGRLMLRRVTQPSLVGLRDSCFWAN